MAFFFVGFPLLVLISKLGIKWSTILALIFMGIGTVIRIGINQQFYLVHAGNLLTGVSCPILYIISVKFVNDWFDDNSRGIWLAVTALAGPVGSIVSFAIPNLVVKKGDPILGFTEKEIPDRKAEVQLYLIIEGGIAIVVSVLTFLFFKDPRYAKGGNPDNQLNFESADNSESFVSEAGSPSDGEDDNRVFTFGTVIEECKHVLSVPIIKYLLLIYMICYGTVIAFGSTSVGIITTFNYKEVLYFFLNNNRVWEPFSPWWRLFLGLWARFPIVRFS